MSGTNAIIMIMIYIVYRTFVNLSNFPNLRNSAVTLLLIKHIAKLVIKLSAYNLDVGL